MYGGSAEALHETERRAIACHEQETLILSDHWLADTDRTLLKPSGRTPCFVEIPHVTGSVPLLCATIFHFIA